MVATSIRTAPLPCLGVNCESYCPRYVGKKKAASILLNRKAYVMSCRDGYTDSCHSSSYVDSCYTSSCY